MRHPARGRRKVPSQVKESANGCAHDDQRAATSDRGGAPPHSRTACASLCASLDATTNEPFEAIAGRVVGGRGIHAAAIPSDVPSAGPVRVEPQAEASPEGQVGTIEGTAPNNEVPVFGAEDLDESLLGWNETTEASAEAATADAAEEPETDASSIARTFPDEGDVTWAELKREVTGTGDSTVVFLTEAAGRALSPDKAEKLRGYAARLEVALRTYSRAANDEN